MGAGGRPQHNCWCQAHAVLVFCCALVCCTRGYVNASSLQSLSSLAVQDVRPSRVTLFTRTPVTVAFNGSICEQLGQAQAYAIAAAMQLVLQGASADSRRNFTFRSTGLSSNCDSLEFQLMLDTTARAGSFPAHIVAPAQLHSWQLPTYIVVVVPPLLGFQSLNVSVPADQNAFPVNVRLTQPAPASGVAVRLQLQRGADSVRRMRDTLTWPSGSSAVQSFWLSLQSVPSSGRLQLQLVQPSGAVVDPAASTAEVLIQSPVISFVTNLGYYRGINTTKPLIHFKISGVSAFPAEFAFRTQLLPGSRPAASPCHPLAAACSMADVEAVNNVTVTGTRWLAPGQTTLQPIELGVNWNRLPPEAELRVAVKIVPQRNVRVAQQRGEAAAIVFGTPLGRCPPGSALVSDDASRRNSSHDGPTYTDIAALQELALAVFPEPKRNNDSSNNSSARTNAADGAGPAQKLPLQYGSCNSSSSSSCDTSTSDDAAAESEKAMRTVIDLDPPFRPMVDRYIALLPPRRTGAGKLLLASSRRGDVVVVDASACERLESARFQVNWNRPDRMWRQRYALGGQKNPCWLRVHVFTMTEPSAPAVAYDSSDGGGSNKTSSSMWDLPVNFVLYRSYTIRFIPLRPPEQLSLRAITFSNSGTTVIACGVPRSLSHLFETAPQAPVSSVMSSMSSTTNSNNSRTSTTTFVGGFAPAVVSSTDDSTSTEAGSYRMPRPLIPAPGQQVQMAYLVLMTPGAAPGSKAGSSSSSGQQHAAATADLSAGVRSRQEQYSLVDPISNKTIIWSRYTSVDCAQDQYILLPLAQLRPDMKMVPELIDTEAEGVNISMSEAALALPGSETSATDSSNQVASNKAEAVSLSTEATAAAVDGGQGYGGMGPKNLGDSVWCTHLSSKRGPAGTAGSALGSGSTSIDSNNASLTADSTGSSSNSNPCGLRLPGVTAELPVILSADEGMSSKTYTLLLYSNESAAAAVRHMVLPQEAAAAASAAKTAAASGSSGNSTPEQDAAQLSAAFFASRPKDWPTSPAQSDKCSVCPNGTYSTRIDAYECKVCPPGKYAASPFSTTCLFCPPGSFSYYWGAPACRTCLPGTYAATAGSLFCDICRDGTTTYTEGATSCNASVADGGSVIDAQSASDFAILLSFGVVLDGTMLEAVTRSTTGINGSSEGIVAVLVRSDTASALNVSVGNVQVLAVQQMGTRQLLVNVSATVPVPTDDGTAAATQDLSADELIQRLIDDPNTFLRTTQTLGAESASVQDVITHKTRRSRLWYSGNLHAVLWPTLIGSLLMLAVSLYMLWKWRRGRRHRNFVDNISIGLGDAFGDLGRASGAVVAGFTCTGVHGALTPRSYPLRQYRAPSNTSSEGSASSSGGDVGIAVDGGGFFAERFAGRAGALRRGWHGFWSTGVRVELHNDAGMQQLEVVDGATPRAAAHVGARGAGSSVAGTSSGNSSPGSFRSSVGSDEICVTIAMGECGNRGVPLSEESFSARLRAKQLNSQLGAAETLSSRHHRSEGCWQ